LFNSMFDFCLLLYQDWYSFKSYFLLMNNGAYNKYLLPTSEYSEIYL
jgi:hypothetical protein